MQRRKNIRLIIILTAVVSAVLFLEFYKDNRDSLGVNKKLFQLDPNREINKVELRGSEETNQFDFHNGRWHLNDSLYLDQSMRDVFFSVISQLEIRRPVLQTKADSIVTLLIESGVRTSISFGDELIQQYWIGGNSQEQVSWVMGEEKVPYQVHIPGYQSYVAGIFSVPATDWRSRFLLEVNFALLRSIEINYSDGRDSLTLNYENNFFSVPGIEADSLKVANFLESLSFLQASSFVKPIERSEYAAATLKEPVAYLNLHLVNGQRTTISFYEYQSENQFLLASLKDGSLAKTDRRVLDKLFKIPADFE